ncbi:MAG: Tol-Pal system beta propeller repeat protein TolB [Deltaproteobacteria bacterium]|nr:Tol-Pal system beta propeller repeat protein TolB [Deltaproteobacteria bacterium]
MKRMLSVIVILLSTTAHARIYIPVNQPSDKKLPIAIPDLVGGGFGEDVAEIIRNDLTLSGYFQVITPEIYEKRAREEGTTLETIQFNYWQTIEAHALVKGEVQGSRGKLSVSLRLFDPYAPEMIVGKEYQAGSGDIREIAHRFADEIMEALTGRRGVFNTKITYAMVTNKKQREVYIMDMDGERARAVTKLRSMSLSPAWSPDGSHLVFTSYTKGRPDLYTIGVDGRGLKRLTENQGANLTPVWSPNGERIIYASSETGEAELYSISPDGANRRRLTQTMGIDLSPDFSPDGSEVVFASERSGNLHVFKMSVHGGATQRLTYVGYQNDLPEWSPLADKIAFSGRDSGTFDIFIMNPDGSNIQRLTIRSGSNEHPTFSPDGRFIAFQSTRDGTTAIYLMRADGSNQTRISKHNGMLPQWGPRVE